MIAKRGPSAMTAKSSPHAMMSREKLQGRSREESRTMQRRQRAAPMQCSDGKERLQCKEEQRKAPGKKQGRRRRLDSQTAAVHLSRCRRATTCTYSLKSKSSPELYSSDVASSSDSSFDSPGRISVACSLPNNSAIKEPASTWPRARCIRCIVARLRRV